MSDFHLLDLPSQGLAVQALLRGTSPEEKIKWLAAHGRVSAHPVRQAGTPALYLFESYIGLECIFFIDGEEFVFVGDHTTYTAK